MDEDKNENKDLDTQVSISLTSGFIVPLHLTPGS